MKKIIGFLLLPIFLFLPCIALTASAAPAALSAWENWVRENHPDLDCLHIANSTDERRCAWPGKLSIAIDERGAQFEQSWQISAATWVTLPGNRAQWPLDVTLNGRPAVVVEHEQLPAIKLEPGNYAIRGSFMWNNAPQFINVPAQTALFELRRDGKIFTPAADSENRIWLRNTASAQTDGSDSIKAEVFRKISDELPREMTTVLRLSVAGKARELLLGRFLLKDLEPIEFDSPLPARIEDDGRLRIQARAGQWEITLRARFIGDINRFRMERLGDQWPAQELWSFAANQALRRVKINGASPVDPSQVDLPESFANLPTYLMEPNSEFALEQQDRGDAHPAANELTLDKTLWLDFGGDGATVRDIIRGRMTQSWRLDVLPDMVLGRATVGGEPQLITRIAKDDSGGVEIRNANVNVEAISRVAALHGISASGWNSEFSSERLSLQLPPGWKLWHASGPDVVQGSWVSQWNLWNIFLAMLLIGAIYKLNGLRTAILALITICLTYHEFKSPVQLYLPILIITALLRVLTLPKFHTVTLQLGYLFSIALIVSLLSFSLSQIRMAIYPQLEINNEIYSPMTVAAQPEELVVTARRVESASAPALMKDAALPSASYSSPRQNRYQPNSNVQTGPGVPAWAWRAATLQWSGPVTTKDSLHLYLSKPWLTRLLKLLDVILSSALAAILLRDFWRARGKRNTQVQQSLSSSAALSLLFCMGFIMHPPIASAEEFPPKYLLDELEQRLTKQPDCLPDCAAVESALIKVSGDRIAIDLRINTQIDLGVPLPTIANWQPQNIAIDGATKNIVARFDDAQSIPLSQGRHDVVLEGQLHSDDVVVQFAMLPHDVHVIADQWDVYGLNGRQLSANTLQLQKHERTAQRDTLSQESAKPFVRVTRAFDLDLDWTLTTTVTRIAPLQGAINVTVPLLPGESVVTNGLAVSDGKIAVTLGSQQTQFQWTSVLKPSPQLQLSAPDTPQWIESWDVVASPKWHVVSSGLTPVKLNGENAAQWHWQPWPGESLLLTIGQPTAMQGATTTVENAELILTPGGHGSDLSVQFDIASSVGGDYHLELRESAELKSAKINNIDVSQPRTGDKVALPLNPGKNHVEIHWRTERGITLYARSPDIVFDTPVSNIKLQIKLPQDRWPLWVSGPSLGPAMLFWGAFVMIIALSLILGVVVRRLRLSIPVSAWQWLLLGMGMSTISIIGCLPVVLWFFAMEARSRLSMPSRRGIYNLMQIGIVLLTIVAALDLFSIIPRSLLSTPDMQVTGNGSHNYFYQWYQDKSGQLLPTGAVFSVSIWFYRLAMLLWSLWLVFALLRWIKWGWQRFNEGTVWKNKIVHESIPIPND